MKKILTQSILSILLLICSLSINAQEFGKKKNHFSKNDEKIIISTQWEKDYATKDEVVHLALIIELADRHHINVPTHLQLKEAIEKNVIAMEINIKKITEGVSAQSPIYPTPKVFTKGIDKKTTPLKINIYDKKTVIYIPFLFSSNIKVKDTSINIDFKYQVCDDKLCYFAVTKKITKNLSYKSNESNPALPKRELFKNLPKKKSIETPLVSDDTGFIPNLTKTTKPEPLFGNKESAPTIERIKISTKWEKNYAIKGDTVHLGVIIELADKHHVNPPKNLMAKTADPFLIPTEITLNKVSKGVIAQPTIYPKPHTIQLSYDPDKPKYDVNVYEGKTVFYIPFRFTAGITSKKATINFDLGYQVCDDRACYRPKSKTFEVTLDYKADHSKADIVSDEIFKNIPNTQSANASINKSNLPLTSFGFIVLIAMAMLGGLLLNFTPCVLPVIPIKIMSLTNHSDSKKRSILLGFSMVAGIISFWLVMGGLITGVKSFQTINRFFQFGSFSIGMGIFVAIMAIGMCGLFTINVPQSISRFNPSFDSVAGSFGIGIMTAILSTPCTAPFMGSATAGATTQPTIIVMAIFFFVGLGMAMPYGILSIYPKLVSWLPKSGPSSVAIKQTMGIFMLAAAFYFIGTGLITIGYPEDQRPHFWWPTMFVCLCGGLAIIIYTLKIKPAAITKSILLTIGLVIAVYSSYLAFELTKKGPNEWQSYSPALLENVKKQNKPIIIDFTAAWCMNCLALEKSVLESEAVLKAIKDYDVQLIKVDITKDDPQKLKFLQESGSITIPYLIILDRKGKTVFNGNFYYKSDIINNVKTK